MRESKGLMGLTAPALGYDGMLIVGQQQVPVRDGVLSIGGKQLFVSEDGSVMNGNQQVGRVVNRRIMPMQEQAQGQNG